MARVHVTTFTLLLFLYLSLATATHIGGNLGGERGSRKMVLAERRWYLAAEKRLAGPGSSPPTCRSKCGRCAPCKAVHVPIQPGMSLPQEYYPEAWRCKCGNKLFMP